MGSLWFRLRRLADYPTTTGACAIRCDVVPGSYPGMLATFDYGLYADDPEEMWLLGMTVGPDVAGYMWGEGKVPDDWPDVYDRFTVSAIRDYPLATWERAARGTVSAQARARDLSKLDEEIRSDGEQPRLDVEHAAAVDLATLYPGLDQDKTPAGLRKARSLRRLALVAAQYRDATLAGSAEPATEVARLHEVNPNTVRTWLHRARAAGFLPPPPSRREKPSDVLGQALDTALRSGHARDFLVPLLHSSVTVVVAEDKGDIAVSPLVVAELAGEETVLVFTAADLSAIAYPTITVPFIELAALWGTRTTWIAVDCGAPRAVLVSGESVMAFAKWLRAAGVDKVLAAPKEIENKLPLFKLSPEVSEHGWQVATGQAPPAYP